MINHRLLYGMHLLRRADSLNRDDLFIDCSTYRRDAAVDVYGLGAVWVAQNKGAGTAIARGAAFFGACEPRGAAHKV